ncbi:NRAMP family divalent metal transporter [Ideonella sp. YS5]|uniref:NRAMP family divalent metal transporter n=1 Tax=Ideonella sp. YS5 TaxID=3453714 RepID=UPI003EE9F63D
MGQFAEVFLGILTAMGGFVEIGELTFSLNAGTRFAHQLLWVSLLGTVGIMAYCEMAGRVAAVKHRPVFSLIRERDGFNAGAVTLVASLVVSLLTCAAEVGGVALLWQLMSAWPYRPLMLGAMLFLLLVVWFLPFQWIERLYGLGGLMMIVFLVALVAGQPDWGEMARGFVPSWPQDLSAREQLLYAYFAVALLSSIMLPYETYFYASGGIEDQWTPKEVPMNRLVVIVGFGLGALLSVALISLGAEFFAPLAIDPQSPGPAALAAVAHFGRIGLWLAVGGMFFAFGGAAIETCLSGAYNLAQFAGWPWGKQHRKRDTARFTLAWVAILLLSGLVVVTGIDPVQVVEYSIVASVLVLPLSYFPLLMVAQDRKIMGRHANGWLANTLGWFYLVTITLAAVAALPLFFLTNEGQG